MRSLIRIFLIVTVAMQLSQTAVFSQTTSGKTDSRASGTKVIAPVVKDGEVPTYGL